MQQARERAWFRCPHCQRRRAVHYSSGGVFSCRAMTRPTPRHARMRRPGSAPRPDPATRVEGARRLRFLAHALKARRHALNHIRTLGLATVCGPCRIGWPLAGTRQTAERHDGTSEKRSDVGRRELEAVIPTRVDGANPHNDDRERAVVERTINRLIPSGASSGMDQDGISADQ